MPRKITTIEIDADRLRRAILRSGQTNKTIANKMGVSDVYISRYLKDVWPSPEMFDKLVAAIGCSPSEIRPKSSTSASVDVALTLRTTPYGVVELWLNGDQRWQTDIDAVRQGDVQSIELAVPPMVAENILSLLISGLNAVQRRV